MSGFTVLVLEDDDILRRIIVRTLARGGYEALDYPDAAPALAAVDPTHIDLLLTDNRMPTPGPAAIRAFRQKGLQAPVLVVSGNLEADSMAQLEAAGADAFLRKPFEPRELLEKVGELLLRQRSAGAC